MNTQRKKRRNYNNDEEGEEIMIDFHTHILPNVDDGSKSIDETFELLNEAKKAADIIISKILPILIFYYYTIRDKFMQKC